MGSKIAMWKEPPAIFPACMQFWHEIMFFDQPRSFVSHVRSHICSLKYVKSWRGIREKKLYEFLQAIFTDAILVQLLLWQQYSGTVQCQPRTIFPGKAGKEQRLPLSNSVFFPWGILFAQPTWLLWSWYLSEARSTLSSTWCCPACLE